MNRKVAQIFLILGLIFSLGMINGCTPDTEGGEIGDDDLNQENVETSEEGEELEEAEEGEEEEGED